MHSTRPDTQCPRRDRNGSKILIYRIGQLGDTIVALPALWAVRRAFPEASLTYLAPDHPGSGFAAARSVLPAEGLVDAAVDEEVHIPSAAACEGDGELAGLGRVAVAGERRARRQRAEEEEDESEDEEDEQAAQGQQDELFDDQPAAVALLRLEQELHRRPAHAPEAHAVDQVDDDRGADQGPARGQPRRAEVEVGGPVARAAQRGQLFSWRSNAEGVRRALTRAVFGAAA